MGQPGRRILAAHILPNVAPALATCAVLHFAQAISAEATLSFLGAGLPPSQPSLGGLVRAGADFPAKRRLVDGPAPRGGTRRPYRRGRGPRGSDGRRAARAVSAGPPLHPLLEVKTVGPAGWG